MDTLIPIYPFNDYGPIMPGLVIGMLGIFHVFVAQFAIGGGWLMCYFQWLAQTGRTPVARQFLDSYFRVLILISFVIGAVTGVAMWFTAIQVSARTIGTMIDEFHWLWATEWTFFVVEVTAGYFFYRYGTQLTDRARMSLLVLYSVAAWGSLFWINGIISFQLTPGAWQATTDPAWSNVWKGFFNPSFFPSLLFRTAASMAIAALAACIVINTFNSIDREQKRALINKAAHFLLPMILMPLLGVWYLAVMPSDSRGWVMGGSVAMTLFLNLAVGASVLVGGYAIIGLWRQKLYINGATATLLAALAFGATAGGEFIREGSRKPFTIRKQLYSNNIKADEVAKLRIVGITSQDHFPVRGAEAMPGGAQGQIAHGFKVYRNLCAACHTVEGVNGLTHLTETWTTQMKRQNISKLQRLKPFMPPFAGTAEELESLVQYLEWVNDHRPADFAGSVDSPDYEAVLRQNKAWLDQAGPLPVIEAQRAALRGTVPLAAGLRWRDATEPDQAE